MKFEAQPNIPDKKLINNALQEVINTVEDINSLPLEYAKVVRNQTTHVDSELRRNAVHFIRRWTDYVAHNNVDESNPFLLRYHLTRFAEEIFGRERERVDLQEVDIQKVSYVGETYSTVINPYVSNEIVKDKHVALIGGVARLALKMHAGVSIEDELPINDVDIIISTDVDIPETAKKYNVDLTGAKVVDGEIPLAIQRLITNFDCTMNQVAIHDGKLLFPKKSLEDIKEGNIRIIAKDDPLFGSEGEIMDDGNVYLNRVGFYRGLSFLIRGKGKQLIVSKENIEKEKGAIGRYWLVMLYVKILPMKNKEERKKAIAHWYEIAKRIGSTETNSPEEFLRELKVKYPEMRTYNHQEKDFDINQQVRWLIGKLTTKVTYETFEKENKELPTSYTESNLTLSNQVKDYDYDHFMGVVEEK